MVATSAHRVHDQSDAAINERIRRQTERRLGYFAAHPDQIDQRLRELDEEWDVERALETGSSTLTLFGLTLGILGRRRWFLLSVAVQGFFMQHALQGWCPPLPILRQLGFRTVGEIDEERYALKALRGDFRDIASSGPADGHTAERALEAARLE